MPAQFLSVDDYVDRVVSDAPPVTPGQLDRLRVLLAPAAPVGADRS